MDENSAYVLPPGSELKWQQTPFNILETQGRIYNCPSVVSDEDRQMWSFMIEMEFLHGDIACFANSLIDYSRSLNPFENLYFNHETPDFSARLHQLQSALQNWDERLPEEHRYTFLPPVKEQCVIIQLDTVKIPRWMRIVYLVSKLYLYEIRMNFRYQTFDVSTFKDCLETAAEFVKIIRILPGEELIHDPVIFSTVPFICRVLLTIINCLIDDKVSNFTDAEKLLISRQAREQLNSMHEILQNVDPVWQYTIQDISQLTRMKEIANQAFSLLEASLLEPHVVTYSSSSSECSLVYNPEGSATFSIPDLEQELEKVGDLSDVSELENLLLPYCN
ncbi:hypothetical protein K7432_011138 [Basidiobolus ranarum]|uniref:Uncharacterized protein n=1 Tax=Basidiobolus ranarum TaxID=34480 RepID=A0ABR2VUH1_9FUNG